MTPEQRARDALILLPCYAPMGGHSPAECPKCRAKERVATAIREAAAVAETSAREVCIGIIKQYLLFNSQRAVSWHEVQDAITALRREVGGSTP